MKSLRPDAMLLVIFLLAILHASGASAQPQMVVEPDTLDLGQVFVGDTVYASFRVINVGDTTFQVSSGSLEIEPDLDIQSWKADSPILPGDTVIVPVIFIPRSKQGMTAYTQMRGKGTQFFLVVKATAIPRHIYLGPVNDRPLTLTGCPQGSIHQVAVINPVDTTYTIDSIRFSANGDEGWRFVGDVPNDGTTIAAGDTMKFFVSREAADRDVSLSLFSAHDTDRWTYKTDRQIASPYIRTPKSDTITVDLKPGDSLNVESQLANRGPATYRIQSATSQGDPLWILVPPDTTRTLFTGFLPIIMHFAGTSQPGIYATTFSISGTPCDTVLHKTLIARVGQASVLSQPTSDVVITFDPAREFVRITSSKRSAYSIYDLLGHEVLTGTSESGFTSIPISMLPKGAYFLRLSTGSTPISRAFVR